MAGDPTIGLVIERKVQMHNRKLGLKNSDIVCDMPLLINGHTQLGLSPLLNLAN
jgi:hypothetical protein